MASVLLQWDPYLIFKCRDCRVLSQSGLRGFRRSGNTFRCLACWSVDFVWLQLAQLRTKKVTATECETLHRNWVVWQDDRSTRWKLALIGQHIQVQQQQQLPSSVWRSRLRLTCTSLHIFSSVFVHVRSTVCLWVVSSRNVHSSWLPNHPATTADGPARPHCFGLSRQECVCGLETIEVRPWSQSRKTFRETVRQAG